MMELMEIDGVYIRPDKVTHVRKCGGNDRKTTIVFAGGEGGSLVLNMPIVKVIGEINWALRNETSTRRSYDV